MKTYAAYYDNVVRQNSSSGGIFSVIASCFDVVYGVAMTDDCYGCKFVRVEDDIARLRGSKYFQASVGDTFKSVKRDLQDGKKVLFSGTGCQINGLFLFLGQNYQNLFLLDIICHGTPSPKLWREYVLYQEKKYGKLESINFRCKEKSWNDFGMKENQVYISKDKDTFMRFFLRNYCLRPSCYECHAKYYKKSDMTIADFWGIENVAPEMNDGKGTSVVLCRTDKGCALFEKIKDQLVWKEVSYEDGVRKNPSEYSSVMRPKERDSFYIDLNKKSFEELEKKYAADINSTTIKRVWRKIKNTIKKKFGGAQVNKGNESYGMLLTFKK